MEYVMVPVPEDLVAEVDQYLRWNTVTSPLGALDIDGALRILEAIDDLARRYLLVVAEAAVDVRILSVGDAAAESGCNELEAMGLMMQLNTVAQRMGNLPLGLIQRETKAPPDGSDAEPTFTFNMRGDVATMVLKAAGRGVATD